MENSTLQLTDSQFNTIINQHDLVLVDFWAPWCGPCVRLAPVIDQLAMLYKGRVVVGKLNIDDNAQTTTQCTIKSIPTLLIFHQGKVVERLVGGNLPIVDIQLALDRYLP